MQQLFKIHLIHHFLLSKYHLLNLNFYCYFFNSRMHLQNELNWIKCSKCPWQCTITLTCKISWISAFSFERYQHSSYIFFFDEYNQKLWMKFVRNIWNCWLSIVEKYRTNNNKSVKLPLIFLINVWVQFWFLSRSWWK